VNFLTRGTSYAGFVLGYLLAVSPYVVNVESLFRSHGLSVAGGTFESLIDVGIYVALGMRALRMLIRKMTQPRRPLRESLLAVIALVLRRIAVRILDVVVHRALIDGRLLAMRADVLTGGVLGIMSRHWERVLVSEGATGIQFFERSGFAVLLF